LSVEIESGIPERYWITSVSEKFHSAYCTNSILLIKRKFSCIDLL